MTEIGEKELFYIRLLPADEMADHICYLPYTLVEKIIETASAILILGIGKP